MHHCLLEHYDPWDGLLYCPGRRGLVLRLGQPPEDRQQGVRAGSPLGLGDRGGLGFAIGDRDTLLWAPSSSPWLLACSRQAELEPTLYMRGSSLPRLGGLGIATRWWISRGLGDRDALRTFSQRLRYACVIRKIGLDLTYSNSMLKWAIILKKYVVVLKLS